ncbi:MAG: hypothetical protein IT269_04295 [Saprospiraceae bacterium]|nr:hypothetical protein [Saprospiraceae bacterium]
MEQILEILKYVLPAAIVFATAYFLLKSHLDNRLALERLRMRNDSMKLTLPIRLQAYERLTLLCERASIQNTLLRVRMPEMNVGELRGALLLAISQEFEHNTSQQLYVSETLWKIISLAKNDTLALVANIAPELNKTDDADLLASALMQELESRAFDTSMQRALMAIRTEAGQLF